jgi:hypothetical protein
MMNDDLRDSVAVSARKANGRVVKIVALAVAIILTFQIAIFGLLWDNQQELGVQNETLAAQAEAVEIQAKLARKQARQAKKFTKRAACDTLEHRVNSRSAERATLALIRSVIVATGKPEFRDIARNLRLPGSPGPRLINEYRRNCKGPGHFYDPDISRLIGSKDKAPKRSGSPTTTTKKQPTTTKKQPTTTKKQPTTPGKSNPKGKARGHNKQKGKKK